MLEHKQPGKSTLTGHHSQDHTHGHGHPHGHGPTPGKQTLVEQHEHGQGPGHGGGAIASAASADGASIGTSATASLTVHDGPVRVENTVTLSLSTGSGPVSINLGKGSLSVGTDQMSFDIKTPGAARDGKPGLTGAGATVGKGKTTFSGMSVKSGVLTGSWSTTYAIKGHHWSGSLTVAVVASSRLKPPPPPEHHGLSKIWHSVTHFLAKAGHVAAKALHEFVELDSAFVHSTNKWGAAFVESLAAAAAAGEVIVVAV